MQLFKKNLKQLKSRLKFHIEMSYYCHFYYGKIKKNYVLLESRNGAELAGNIFRIIEELALKPEYEHLKLFLSIKKEKFSVVRELFEKYKIQNVTLVKIYSFKYFRLLAQSKYLINDTSFPRRFIKKEGQVYLNTWHGVPLKVMGRKVLKDAYSSGNVIRNLFFSDYLLFPNQYMKNVMVRDYMLTNLYTGTFLMEGYPRNTAFFNHKRREDIRKKLNISCKQVIVYMPTWRGTMKNKNITQHIEDIQRILSEVDGRLNNDQIMFVKLHPMVGKACDCSNYQHVQIFPNDWESYDVLNTADILITDYSSVFFDFAVTKRKIILYPYDEEQYLSDRGLYFNLEELPFPRVYDVNQLVNEINAAYNFNYRDFFDTYCSYDGNQVTQKICQTIFLGKPACKETHIDSNGKENILFYVGNMAKNGITTAFLNLADNLDHQKYNIIASFRETVLKKAPQNVSRIPDYMDFIPLSSDAHKTLYETFCDRLFIKYGITNSLITRSRNRLYQRELKKHFGNIKLKTAIQYNGYEVYAITLFENFPINKAIWVHNDMINEIALRHNQNLTVLKSAYRHYDKVIAVTDDLLEPTLQISGNKNKIEVINNIYNYTEIREKAMHLIEFQKDTVCRFCPPSGFNSLLENNDIKIVTIGRFSPEKGHMRLIDAFETFNEKYPNSRLIIIGGHGKLYLDTVRRIQRSKCWDKISIILSIENPMPVLKKCDLFILPSFYEGFGLVLVEADVLGLPIISTDITGPRHFMQENGGYLVEDSTEGLLQGMYDFMDGKVKKLNVNYEAYNKISLEKFERLVSSKL